MKNIFYFIVSVFLCVLLIGGVLKLARPDNITDTPQTSNSQTTEESMSTDETLESVSPEDSATDSGADFGEPEPPETEVEPLKTPENEASYIAEGLEMQTGASIYIGEEDTGPAIRFTFNVSPELKADLETSESKKLYILTAPKATFDEVNTENYTYIDWLSAMQAADKTYLLSEVNSDELQMSGDDYIVRFRLQRVMYKNINREFVSMAFVETTADIETVRQYNAYAANVDYRSNARSIAYVASAALNAHALGQAEFPEEQLDRLKMYVNNSVDYANGLAEPTNDDTMYEFTVIPTGPKGMAVGETFTLAVEIIPNVKVPIWYRSTDESILTVDDNGNVTAKATGTAVIGVYIAGQSYGVTVTVM